jgi:hypothetical protein
VSPQPLEATGNAVTYRDEHGDDNKPMSMPTPDAHANRTFRGRAGTLKASRPRGNASGNAAMPAIRSRRRKK